MKNWPVVISTEPAMLAYLRRLQDDLDAGRPRCISTHGLAGPPGLFVWENGKPVCPVCGADVKLPWRS